MDCMGTSDCKDAEVEGHKHINGSSQTPNAPLKLAFIDPFATGTLLQHLSIPPWTHSEDSAAGLVEDYDATTEDIDIGPMCSTAASIVSSAPSGRSEVVSAAPDLFVCPLNARFSALPVPAHLARAFTCLQSDHSIYLCRGATNDEPTWNTVKSKLSARLKMKDLGIASYCLGLEISQDLEAQTVRIRSQANCATREVPACLPAKC
ncbi:hypothetical protein B0H14DRAFT_3558289 [Mycena olivaceomarginata]|nr:hypothetical protein B0H14DRAFT_3558289 [Mycena olivaceomarginata]